MKKVLLITFCIFLPILLLLFSYKIVLGFTDLTENQQQTIDYLQNKEELNLNYTFSEASHLKDVKNVMGYYDYLFYLSLLICTFIITYYKRNQEQLKKLFFYGGIVTVAFTLFKLLTLSLFFQPVFTLFHKIFFPQGNWTFPTQSLLIQTFPLDFFINISLMIFGLAVLLGALFILMGYKFKKK